MDPFADKVLVLGGFILLAGPAFTSPVSTTDLLVRRAVDGGGDSRVNCS